MFREILILMRAFLRVPNRALKQHGGWCSLESGNVGFERSAAGGLSWECSIKLNKTGRF